MESYDVPANYYFNLNIFFISIALWDLQQLFILFYFLVLLELSIGPNSSYTSYHNRLNLVIITV
jgi:hypothetical protein